MQSPFRNIQLPEFFCGLLIVLYLTGSTLSPEMEKIGQIGLLLWAVVFMFFRPWREQPLTKAELGLMAAFGGFVLAAALSYWVAGNDHDADKMMTRHAKFLFFIPVFILFRRFASADWFFYCLLFVGGVNAVWIVLELTGWVEGCSGGFCWDSQVSGGLNPIQYGNLMLCFAAMLLAGLPVFRKGGPVWLGLALLVATLCFSGVFASGTRGAILALPLLGLGALVIAWRNQRFGMMLVIVPVLVALSAVPSLDYLSYRANTGIEEFQTVETITEDLQSTTSIGIRFHMWSTSWELIKESPWLGVGVGQYEAHAQALYDQGKANYWAVYSHPHSEYFSVLTTRGLVGLAALGILFLAPLLYFWRHLTASDAALRASACAGVMLVLEIGQAGLTESVFRLSSTMGIYIMGIALLAAMVSRKLAAQTSPIHLE